MHKQHDGVSLLQECKDGSKSNQYNIPYQQKAKNHMIISRDAEATDKIQHILVIKILNKIEGKHLNITTKAIYDKPKDNVKLSDENLGFPLSFRNKTRTLTLTTFIQCII